jgi:hypothetical protein
MYSEGKPQIIILYCHTETDTPFSTGLFYLNSAFMIHLDHKPHLKSLSFLRACCYIQFYYQPHALIY